MYINLLANKKIKRRWTKYFHPEIQFIKNTLHNENSFPDQVKVSGVFNNYKIAEFVAAYFTFLSKILINHRYAMWDFLFRNRYRKK
jgi:hypothetical protein